MTEPSRRALCERLTSDKLSGIVGGVDVASSVEDLLGATRDAKTITFLDRGTLAAVAATKRQPAGPVLVVCDEPLPTAIGWLQPYSWVAHVISNSLLAHPIIDEHLENVLRTLMSSRKPRLLDWYVPSVVGRRIRLTHASRREERLERMTEFFDSKAVGARTLQTLRDAAEELLTNAFYDAPVAAGAVKKAVSRTHDIALPDDSACDLAYGCREDLAIVRVRDPFGSLTRPRLVEVLSRCAQSNMKVQVDETMGGAGLGMWRVFSGATFVVISVIKDRHTEILVGVSKKAGPGPRPFAFHLYFKDAEKRRFWRVADDDTNKPDVNHSVMIAKPK